MPENQEQQNKEPAAYSIGLDIGINGVGWAVVDEKGKLQRHGRHHLWGVSLFDEAQTARKRANQRRARRSKDRKAERVQDLRGMLNREIEKVDPAFYQRLDETSLTREDRQEEHLYRTLPEHLFEDGTCEVDLSRKHMPEYFIRQQLVHTRKKADIRYVYLALAHLFQHRGHFLHDAGGTGPKTREDAARDLRFALREYAELTGKTLDRSSLTDEIAEVLYSEEDPRIAEEKIAEAAGESQELSGMIRLILGEEEELSRILPGREGKISFEKLESNQIYDQLDEAEADIILALQDLHAWRFAEMAARSRESVSDLMIARYESHREDLKALKAWYRKYASREAYRQMFHDDTQKVSYNAYTRSRTNPAEYRDRKWNHCTQEALYKKIREEMQKRVKGTAEAEPLLRKMFDEKGNVIVNGFLPLQHTQSNRFISNLQQRKDLIAILENQAPFHPAISYYKKRIIEVFDFRIPFYVGPLRQNSQSPFKPWIKYKKRGTTRIRPWTLEERVDLEATGENYITNMVRQCTYLPKYKALPKHSIYYEKFMVLDELNRVRLNKKLIPLDIKEKMVDELFSKYRNVTDSLIRNWLIRGGYFKDTDSIVLTTANGSLKKKFKSSMNARICMEKIFHRRIDENDPDIENIEQIILWATIYKDKRLYVRRIRETYAGKYTPDEIEQLCSLTFEGWGAFSRELLTDKICVVYEKTETGENSVKKSVLEVMEETNRNFMQVYHKRTYELRKNIRRRQSRKQKEYLSREYVDSLPCSPAMRRAIWRSVRILREIIDFKGNIPESVYIRNNREENAKRSGTGRENRKRYEAIRLLYENYEEETGKEIRGSLKAELQKCKDGMTDTEYLYFLQMGKCAYSGEEISLADPDSFAVEAVVPQSIEGDASVSNKVLIAASRKIKNRGTHGTPAEVVQNMRDEWAEWNRYGFLSRSKQFRLEMTEYDIEAMKSFTESQFNETGKIIQVITGMLKSALPNSHVYGINAILTERIKKANEIYTISEVNDTAKAYNAFLTAHLGVFADFFKPDVTDEENYTRVILKTRKMAGVEDKNGIIATAYAQDQDGEGKLQGRWSGARERADYIRNVSAWHDLYVTYMPVEFKGQFYTETLYRKPTPDEKGKTEKRAPIDGRRNDPLKYGGHLHANTGYMAAVSYERKGKTETELVNIPVYITYRLGKEPDLIMDYIQGELGFNEENGYRHVSIRKRKIKLNQLALIDGHPYYLRSATELQNAKQAFIKKDLVKTIWKLVNYSEKDLSFLVEKDALSEREIREAADYLLQKYQANYGIYPAITKSLMGANTEKLSWETCLQLVKILIACMGTHGTPIAQYTKKERLREELPIKGDTRIFNKRIRNDIELIHQSVTGIYEKRERL